MNFVLSTLPILILLCCLLVLKLNASKAGAICLIFTVVISTLFFKIPLNGLSIALSKGSTLSLYVLLIIWSAVLLYHMVSSFKALEVITQNMLLFIKDSFVQFLILAWLFSSVLQGIAGFGVPVIIVVPILIQLGFDPIKSAAAVLLGHSWSVSFGSMGSSFYSIFLVTGLSQQHIGYSMVIFDAVAMIMMGGSVCFLYDGFQGVKKGIYYILPTSIMMIGVMLTTLHFELYSLIGLLSSLSGAVTLYLLYLMKAKESLPHKLFQNKLTLGQAVLPYGVIIMTTLIFQMFKSNALGISFQYPQFATGLGYTVSNEVAFAKIKLLGHPAFIILIAVVITGILYQKKSIWCQKIFKEVLLLTLKKCIPTSVSLVFLTMSATVMMDSGMTNQLAVSIAQYTDIFYLMIAPFIGVLGSFITGSNTNSNVLFGKFQNSIASALHVNSYLMCGLQSISGSIGVSLGPTTLLMASTASGYTGRESELYKKVLTPVIITALLMGGLNAFLQIFF